MSQTKCHWASAAFRYEVTRVVLWEEIKKKKRVFFFVAGVEEESCHLLMVGAHPFWKTRLLPQGDSQFSRLMHVRADGGGRWLSLGRLNNHRIPPLLAHQLSATHLHPISPLPPHLQSGNQITETLIILSSRARMILNWLGPLRTHTAVSAAEKQLVCLSLTDRIFLGKNMLKAKLRVGKWDITGCLCEGHVFLQELNNSTACLVMYKGICRVCQTVEGFLRTRKKV